MAALVGTALKRLSLTAPLPRSFGPDTWRAVIVTGTPFTRAAGDVPTWLASLAHVAWAAPSWPISTLMKSAMLRLPGGAVAPHSVPCRQMSPMWLGFCPSRACWKVGLGVSPLVVTDMNGYHCLSFVCRLGCSRL